MHAHTCSISLPSAVLLYTVRTCAPCLQVADLYCEAVLCARGYSLECEAIAACQLGTLYTEVLQAQGEETRRKGREYFKVCAWC